MNTRSTHAICALLFSLHLPVLAQHSNYVGQESRDIKALAPSEVNDLMAGRGMGFAKAAELNGYPGPMHVLEIKSELALSDEQERSTRELFARMQRSAQELGAQLIEAERALDVAFRERRADPAFLTAQLSKIGSLQAQVREIHLQAHLEQTKLLTPQQVTKYMSLRGYGLATATQHHRHRH